VRRGRGHIRWNTGVPDENGRPVSIRIGDAASYLTEEFWQCYNVYCMTENMGCLPFGGGWAEQPEWITRAVNLFKIEASEWESREREGRKPKVSLADIKGDTATRPR
jgi:hypothetical protein